MWSQGKTPYVCRYGILPWQWAPIDHIRQTSTLYKSMTAGLLSQILFWQYCRSKYSADIYIYCYTIITLVVVTLYYWWHLSHHKRWSNCIWAPDFINPIHQLRFVMSDCWTSMNNYIDGKQRPLSFQGPLIPAHVAVEDVSLPSDQDMTSSESKILSISIRGDGNIHFSYWDRCQ